MPVQAGSACEPFVITVLIKVGPPLQLEFGLVVTPKTSHLNAVKRIFKYLKGKPNLGLWYPIESPFDLEAFPLIVIIGRSKPDRKTTTGVFSFFDKDLSHVQSKKQPIVATSTIEAEYVLF
ncbi:hypothetical protein Tco_1108276 [Tanacetum coccineum]